MIGRIRSTLLMVVVGLASPSVWAQATLAERNAELLRQLQTVHQLSPAQMEKIRAIFAASAHYRPRQSRHHAAPRHARTMRGEAAAAGRDL